MVGVSVRFGGVAGSDAVLIRGLPLAGVTGRSSFLSSVLPDCSGTESESRSAASSTFCGSATSSGLKLFLRLDGLNMPAKPLCPLLADLTVSESPDFLRDRVNAPLSFSTGEVLRSGTDSWSVGSIIWGTLVLDRVGMSSVAVETGLVSALISGEDNVR